MELMKVKNESKIWKQNHNGICDFCGCREARHSINGSLWFICSVCMKHLHDDIPKAISETLGDDEE